LARGEAHLLAVIRQGKYDNDISKDGKETPEYEQPKLESLENVFVEGDVDSPDGLVSVPQGKATEAVHDEG
jgi:hypothetical protein